LRRGLARDLLAIRENRQDEISPRMSGLIAGLYEIIQVGEKEANCCRLMSVPGVGPLISTAVVAAIGTGEAFECGRDFGAWLGLVPRQYSTGGRSVLGRISKRGSKYLRTLFIQAANVILMRPHNWERFSFGTWLLNAAPRLHRNKLATALANKLARITWSILRSEKPFDASRLEVTAI
jgi:transposase